SRELPPASRAPLAPLLAGVAALAAHAAVDFPLHTFPGGLLLVVLAAGLRLHGVAGPERVVELRFRPAYAASAFVLALVLAVAAARPVAGFWYFLRGLGAPPNLLREKWALEEAPRRPPSAAESVRLLGLAASIDPACAPYHRALGSRLFQGYLRREAGDEALARALYELNYATQLNPNAFAYFVNLGQAMTSLARLAPPGRERLAEALAHYRHAASLAPFQYAVYEDIGALADELGDAPGAEDAFRRAVAIERYFLRGWLNLGAFYARHGRTGEAREVFLKGASLATEARSLVPTTPQEREIIAPEPSVFYNELRKLDSGKGPEGTS
ncbi:MAG TPA: tetratricopeptide repeat protein, partial [Anaeromyxobacter sp.]